MVVFPFVPVTPINFSLCEGFFFFFFAQIEIACLVLGADINVTNEDGETPLMYASKVHNIKVIELLIQKGADINVGVSHTNGYATLIMSHTKNVSVDIEYINDRVDRIAERFIRDDETALCTLSRLVHWCVKETLYKYFSEQKLGYYEMRLHPFELSSEGKVFADNLRENTTSAVFYKIADEYVITYMFA